MYNNKYQEGHRNALPQAVDKVGAGGNLQHHFSILIKFFPKSCKFV